MRTLRGDASHGPRTVGGSHRTAIPHPQGTMATTIFGSHELSVPRQIGNGFKVSSDGAKRRGAAVSSEHCQLSAEKSVCRAEIRRAAAHRRMRRRHQGRVVSTSNPISCSSACKSSFTRSAKRPFSTKSGTLRANCAAWFVSPPKLIVISPATGRRPGDVHQTITAERTVCAQTRLRPDLSSRGRGAQPRERLAEATARSQRAGVLKA
jgi:hypothetical protein